MFQTPAQRAPRRIAITYPHWMTHTTDTLNNAAIEAAHQVHGVSLRESAGGRQVELVASVKQPQSARLAQTELGCDAAQQNRDEVAASHAVDGAMLAL